jgi:hypothetical protein
MLMHRDAMRLYRLTMLMRLDAMRLYRLTFSSLFASSASLAVQ